ncbi:hypothetical protein NON00_23730, partial [Roseomonas sp. GC11]|uniref:hypothetical protein n=1 Tax=Roseomonas sp. GC11 TaxID=2950546 RepID=UPI00210C4848
AGARRVALPAGGRGVASLGVAPGGRRLWIEIASPATALEEREIGIGVTSLGHAAADAVGQRLDLLEARHFRRARVVAEGA